MTHDEMCVRAAIFLKSNGFGVAFHDKFKAGLSSGEIPDALGFRNGTSCLIEVKCSRSDFFADRMKHFRQNECAGVGDWRFFMCEPGLITIEDLPEKWGLLYAEGKKVIKVHGWPSNAMWYDHKPFISDKQSECDYMYSALRRMVVRGHFDSVYDKPPTPREIDNLKKESILKLQKA